MEKKDKKLTQSEIDSKNIASITKNIQFIAWTFIISILILLYFLAKHLGETGAFRAY